ncbi:unnamed protein product [Rhodiola kirilowii]
MISLSWNCRGLGGAATVRALANLVRIYKPSLIGVMETKAEKERMEQVRRQLGFDCGFSVERKGRSGGLAIWWNNSCKLAVKSFSDYHIDAIIEEESPIRVTMFYGHPMVNRRAETWELLRRLKSDLSLPWLVFGDFNEVLFGWEVKGRCIRGEWQMKRFRQAMEDCGLSDLGFRGNTFTFSNKRKGSMETKARLDRALANQEWRKMFPEAEVIHEVSGVSDHAPIVIKWEGVKTRGKLKLFRYEPMWLKHKEYSEKIRDIWELAASRNSSLTGCLYSSVVALEEWGRSCFGNVNKKVSYLKEKLNWIQQQDRTEEIMGEEVRVTRALDDWLYKQEIYWKQRSRVDWLKEGDRNTRYFHLRASQRRKSNRIREIQGSSGDIITNEEAICGEVVNYFRSKVFQSDRGRSSNRVQQEVSFIPRCVSEDMAATLNAPFSDLEVQDAIFQMYPIKAPSPDGFSAIFFQKSWRFVKEKVTYSVLEMLNSRKLEEGVNKTLITLIPKCKSPKRIEEYRPISLCNVAAKIVTKVLANRLKTILPSIISESQSVFVPGRLISDNILMAHEILHFIKTRRRQKSGYCSLKLDMTKAYDRVEWDFLEEIQRRMGFPERWIEMIMACVRTVTYMIRVNDKLSEEFRPERGLRQGDPLSPYLFLVCAEWLAQKLRREQEKAKLEGIKICWGAPEVTHLFFADDSVIFLRARLEDVANLRRILALYEEISGQKVNVNKSEICFSCNVSPDLKDRICEMLEMKQVAKFSKYLGMPVVFSNNKTEMFSFIINKVWQKVQGWKEQTLSMAGKETLIKSVL